MSEPGHGPISRRHYAALTDTIQRYRQLGTVAFLRDGELYEVQPGGLPGVAADRAGQDSAGPDDRPVGLCWVAGDSVPACLRVAVGGGTDIATAATAALSVIEDLEELGILVVPAVETTGSVLVYVSPPRELTEIVEALAARAPEIATTDPGAADGRALLAVVAPADGIPLPHSLVVRPDGVTAVLPVTTDEIAAMAAGMPVDPEPDAVLDRLRTSGDLAAGLVTAPLDGHG